MEIGPVWLFLSYVAVAGFTHLLSTKAGPPAMNGTERSERSANFLEHSETEQPCGFQNFFVNHRDGPGIDKWVHYFPIYEEHFGRFCRGSRNISVAEVGVQSGGSLLMWRHAFGDKLQLMLGIDIDNNTKAWQELGSNIRVEIGSQGDEHFLTELKHKYPGGFDILMDDGSHVPEHQFTTFVHMWSAIKPGGVLMIEDVHGTNPLLKWLLEGHQNAHAKLPGLYYPMGNVGPPNDISRQAGNFLNNYGGKMNMASRIQMEVESIKMYPFIVAITKRESPMRRLIAQKQGTQWIPYNFDAYESFDLDHYGSYEDGQSK